MKAHSHVFELAIGGLGLGFHPLQAIGIGHGLEHKVLLQPRQIIGRGQNCRGRAAQRIGLLALRDLVQIHVIQPHGLAISHDGLLKRLGVDKLELAWALKLKLPAAGLGARGLPFLGGRGHRLRELCLSRLGGAHEVFQALQPIGPHSDRQRGPHSQRQQRLFHPFSFRLAAKAARNYSGRAGTSTSR